MPLIRKQGASAPKELGLFWPMQTTEGMTIDVFIYASSLQSLGPSSVGPVGLLKRHRPALERIASEKFDREGVTDANLLHITDNDIRSAHISETTADEVE
ncbi:MULTISPECIES: hypothetical protein [unclassified Rhizobium]|uniref:hypothetical protein n=1 Tax=unclassified Rhizobium TaxID=2613769 RepID=UPI0006FBF4F1|nr:MULTISPECIES: hypothetical protein [unclassified Rhizobium]KQV42749.1 hypothetical protein ASC86_19050 [Rhizobium sp. Root1212]KRD36483.1 hypothetical protein ASE37_20045 [Rhizobium sp. Root268]